MAISKNISQNEKKTTKDEVYLEERILIPKEEDQNSLFSWRKLWLFTGPGWLSKYLIVFSADSHISKLNVIVQSFFYIKPLHGTDDNSSNMYVLFNC